MTPSRSPARDFLLISLLWLALYVHGMSRMQLKHEEPRRALVAREMIATGEYIVPHLNGHPYLAKPPVFYILIAAASVPFASVTEAAARWPSVLSVFGVAIFVYIMGLSNGGRRLGVLAAVMTITCGLFLEKGAMAEIDMNFAFWVIGGFFFLYRASSPGARVSDWPLAYLFIAVAFLTKGPPALLFHIAALAALIWTDRSAAQLRTLRHAGALLFLIVPVGIWIWIVHSQVGLELLFGTVQAELVDRAVQKSLLNPLELLYYPLAILAGFLPWSIVLLAGLGTSSASADSPRNRLLKFSLATVLISAILFSFSSGKAARYLIPILPILALAAGEIFDRFMDGQFSERRARFMYVSLFVLALMLCVGAAGLSIVALTDWNASPIASSLIGIFGLLIGFASIFAVHARRYTLVCAALVAAVLLYRVAYVGNYIPDSNVRKDISHIVAPVDNAVPAGSILYSHLAPPPYLLYYYVAAPVIRLETLEELESRTESEDIKYCLVSIDDFETLNERNAGRWRVLHAFTYRTIEGVLITKVPASSDSRIEEVSDA